MRFRKEQLSYTVVEPQPLGVAVDLESAALYDSFSLGRGFDEIYGLWKDPEVSDPTIRQRAVSVLTAPRDCKLPFPHPDQSVGRLLHINEKVEERQTTDLRERLRGRPELAEELARGILYWLDATEKLTDDRTLDSRYDYQAATLQLLPLVSEETADALFDKYQIRDLQPYSNMDDASGYHPLTNILYDQAVPPKYKAIGLQKWFAVAEAEEADLTQPREEHERALKNMAEYAQLATFGHYADDEVETSIISFLESHVQPGATYVDGSMAGRIAARITDEDARFNFSWRHIMAQTEDWRRFRIESPQDLSLINWMRQRADPQDAARFEAKADTLIRQYETKRQERASKQAAELALQAQLRAQ